MAAAVAAAEETFGGLDVVVANAGVSPPGQTMKAMDPDVFERTLEIDLFGVVRTVYPALAPIAARGGQVVVISSVYAFATGPLVAPYAAAKAGVEALGRALRVELAPHGAGATVAHFGYVDTVMVQEGFDGDEAAARRIESLPAFVTRRLTPAQAATALLDGIEQRAPRVIAPGWWKLPYYARGLFGPLMDAYCAGTARPRRPWAWPTRPTPRRTSRRRRARPRGRRRAPRTPRRARRRVKPHSIDHWTRSTGFICGRASPKMSTSSTTTLIATNGRKSMPPAMTAAMSSSTGTTTAAPAAETTNTTSSLNGSR